MYYINIVMYKMLRINFVTCKCCYVQLFLRVKMLRRNFVLFNTVTYKNVSYKLCYVYML